MTTLERRESVGRIDWPNSIVGRWAPAKREAASFRHGRKAVDENRLNPCRGTQFNL